jgi:hypothetical protein
VVYDILGREEEEIYWEKRRENVWGERCVWESRRREGMHEASSPNSYY